MVVLHEGDIPGPCGSIDSQTEHISHRFMEVCAASPPWSAPAGQNLHACEMGGNSLPGASRTSLLIIKAGRPERQTVIWGA
jgi:hypothetical protein